MQDSIAFHARTSVAVASILFAIFHSGFSHTLSAQTHGRLASPPPKSSRAVGNNPPSSASSKRTMSGTTKRQNASRTAVRYASATQVPSPMLGASDNATPQASHLPTPAPSIDSSSSHAFENSPYLEEAYDAGVHSHTECDGCDACGMDVGCCCRPSGYLLDWSRSELFVGVASFANAGNFLTTGASAAGQVEGSAGLQEGFNFGSRSPFLLGGQLGAQIGLRAIQAQLDGSTSSPDSRNQLFLTTGLFRRVDYGLQGGLVVDYFRDDWNYKADLLQLRGELSFLLSPCHDVGVRFTSGQRTASISANVTGVAAPVLVNLAAMDTYRFFYRARLGERGRGSAEWNAGFSEDRDAILGLNLSTPLNGSIGLQAGATYVIPSDTVTPAYAFESWNISFGLAWTPGRGFGLNRDYYRPLFDVADNGSFLTHRVP